MSERWLLLDLETTGLDPHKDLILEVCAILFRKNPKNGLLTSADSGVFHRVVGWSSDVLDKHLNAVTREMHTKSGLINEVLTVSKFSNIDSLFHDWLQSFIKSDSEDPAKPDKIRLVGNSVHFDKSFIDAQWPATRTLLSHRVTDISTLLDVHRIWYAPIEKGDVAHRALDDCKQSFALLEKFTGILKDAE